MTVSSSVFTTHTASALTASDPGAFPTPIGCVTLFVSGSTRTTVFDPASPTHTLPNPTAMPRGSSPTGIVLTILLTVGVDARDRPVEPVGHPHAPLAERDTRWAVPDGDRVERLDPCRG